MKKETVKGSLSECVSFINKDIEGIKNNIIKALDEGNASAHDRWLKNLREALSVKKEYDWQLMYSVYETDGHKEIAIWEQDSECNIRDHETWKIVDDEVEYTKENVIYGIVDKKLFPSIEAKVKRALHLPQYKNIFEKQSKDYVYECDYKKKNVKDFVPNLFKIIEDKDKFLLDVSIYPRACGKTVSLDLLQAIDSKFVVLVPKCCKTESGVNENNYIRVGNIDNLRGLRKLQDKIVICEEGFSIYEILKMRDMGINIQCALVNGVE